jgi:toxin FitB
VYETWLVTLRQDYAGRIIPISADSAEEWGRMNVPEPVSTVDGLMAATAKVHGLTLATRTIDEVVRTGVRLLNPFEPVY